MQVTPGLQILALSATVMGKADTLFPTLIWDEKDAILVDTGFPGQAPLIRQAMESAGVPFAKLTRIIITHQDIDHIGSLASLVAESPQGVDVLASELEKPHIQGEKSLIKVTAETIAKAMAAMPPDVPAEWRQAFQRTLENPPKAKVDRTVVDGEHLPYCGGISVIATPGHTPGHICLYHKPSKTLIAGDALTVKGGCLLGPLPQATYDMDLAIQSLQKLTQFDIETVICHHGGMYNTEANRRIAELADGK